LILPLSSTLATAMLTPISGIFPVYYIFPQNGELSHAANARFEPIWGRILLLEKGLSFDSFSEISGSLVFAQLALLFCFCG
jgi:hypothetical protein